MFCILKNTGYACGNLYNTHKEWEKTPEWMKASYRQEMEYLSGDIGKISW